MEYAMNLFMQMPSNREERGKVFEKIKQEILDEVEDPLKVLARLRSTAKLIEALTKDDEINDLILSEAERYGKRFEHAGAKFEIRETGVKFDYSNCNDSVFTDILSELETVNAKKKEREKFLKAIPEEGVPNPDTGEIILRPVRVSTTSVAVTV